MSRTKGSAGEREAIAVLTDELGAAVGKALKRNLQQARDGGIGGDVLGLGDFRIEVKRARRAAHPTWWQQAVEQAGNGIPALMYRIDFSREWRCRVHIGDVCSSEFAGWPREDLSGVLDMTTQAFCALIREHDSGLAPVDATAMAAREIC